MSTMIGIDKCMQVLNKGKNKYSKESVEQIRDILYTLGEIDFNNHQPD